MKIRNTRLSKRTLALLTATAVLLGSGSYTGTRAALQYFSEDYRGGFKLQHLQVHLLENGDDVCHGANTKYTVHRTDGSNPTKQDKYVGNLVEYMGYSNDDHSGNSAAYEIGSPGKVIPGKKYEERIAARNGSDINEYVRLTVKKYWVNSKDNNTRKKDTSMDPELIKLSYGGKAYNSSAWAINSKEHSKESDTYYLRKMLSGGETSADLFDTLQIDASVYDLGDVKTTTTHTDTNKTVITYEYDYDDFTFYIEADVQAIQTHNVNDAIGSLWGVSNVSAGNGTVTVK